MVVVGKECIVFDTTGTTCTVNAFSASAGKLDDIPIVDAVVAYDCPLTSKVFLLLMRNALLVSDMQMNLLPPFIVREAGILLNDCPKSQHPDPTVDVHSLHHPEAGLRIHFGLHNTFSYFNTRKPTENELATCDKVFITPDSVSWNPNSPHFTTNEEAMMGPDGDVLPLHERSPLLLADSDWPTPLPSVAAVELHIDAVVSTGIETIMAQEPWHSATSARFPATPEISQDPSWTRHG